MNFEDSVAHGRLLASGNADQAQNSMVRPFVHDRQFAEVLVQRHEDATIVMGSGENLVIAGVLRPIASPLGVMASGPQFNDGTTPNARIQEQPHPSLGTRRGSTRSRPTTRRAYAKQARMSSGSSHG